MANGLHSLSMLFQNRLFRIPDYQRGYAWKHEQLIDFWEDLQNLNIKKYHYTGLLSLKAIDQKEFLNINNVEWIPNGYIAFHVVDGQQRLTTFSILLFEITKLIANAEINKGKSDDKIVLGDETLADVKKKYIFRKKPPQNFTTTYLFGYEADNPSARYLRHHIFEDPYGGSLQESYYTKNLKYAKKFFADNLADVYGIEGLEGIDQLYQKLILGLRFNLHEIEDEYDVFVAFETMNNRGKKLTNLERLKNRLIYLTTLYNDDVLGEIDKRNLRSNINAAWKEVYYQLGRNQNAPLSDDDFLRAHWITYFKYSRRSGNDYINFLLDKFSAKNIFEKIAIIVDDEGEEELLPDFEMDEDIEIFEEPEEPLQSSNLKPKEINDYVNSLKSLAEHWYYSFFPNDNPAVSDDEKVWIDKLNRVGIGHFRPLVAATIASSSTTKEADRLALFKAIERFLFLSFRVGVFNASYKSSEFYNRAKDVLQGNIELQEIVEALNQTINSDLSAIITNFITRTDRRFISGQGFYGWRDLKYFLYEYEENLVNQHRPRKINWNYFSKVERDKATIEHILPQTPTKWYWKNQFRQYTEDEINILSSSLGNMLPLSLSINSSLQNDSFPDKKNPPVNKRGGYTNGSHSEIEVADEDEWTAERILDRGLKLLNFMEKRWDLILSESQKSQLLHINFILNEREQIDEIPNTEEDT